MITRWPPRRRPRHPVLTDHMTHSPDGRSRGTTHSTASPRCCPAYSSCRPQDTPPATNPSSSADVTAPSWSLDKATTPPAHTAPIPSPGKHAATSTPKPCPSHRPGLTASSSLTPHAWSSPTTTPSGNRQISPANSECANLDRSDATPPDTDRADAALIPRHAPAKSRGTAALVGGAGCARRYRLSNQPVSRAGQTSVANACG